MKLTIEHVLNADDTAALYDLYVTAFNPIRTRAAASHMFNAEEFAAMMTDKRVEKYIMRHKSVPAALMAVTTDLSAFSWISPDYYASRYTDRFASGTLYYLGFVLVHPEHQRQRTFGIMITSLLRRLVREGAGVAFDICAYNDATGFGRRVVELCNSFGACVETLDVQTYYWADFHRPSETGP